MSLLLGGQPSIPFDLLLSIAVDTQLTRRIFLTHALILVTGDNMMDGAAWGRAGKDEFRSRICDLVGRLAIVVVHRGGVGQPSGKAAVAA